MKLPAAALRLTLPVQSAAARRRRSDALQAEALPAANKHLLEERGADVITVKAVESEKDYIFTLACNAGRRLCSAGPIRPHCFMAVTKDGNNIQAFDFMLPSKYAL